VDALAALGRWDDLEAALRDIRSRPANVAWFEAAADRAEGTRLAALGDGTGAQAAMRRALDAYRRLGMSHEIAVTLERLADLDADEDASGAYRAEAAAIRAGMTDSSASPADRKIRQ
jgi:hypothetical protein